MASLTVRNVPDDAKLRFRQVAAAHGRSMEEHLRVLVVEAGMEALDPAVREASASFKGFPEADPETEGRLAIQRLVELGRGIEWDPDPREPEPFRDHEWFK